MSKAIVKPSTFLWTGELGMNVFKEMALSIYSFDSYRLFLKNKKGKVFGFGVLLVLIYLIVSEVIPVLMLWGPPSRMEQNLRGEIPDFRLENGRLWAEDVYDMKMRGRRIYVNTDPDFYFYDTDQIEQYLLGYNEVILVDSEKVIGKSGEEVVVVYFSDTEWEFDREDVLNFCVPWLYIILVIFFITQYIIMVGWFFFSVLFIALFGKIAASRMKYKLPFGKLYLLGVYSRTLPFLINSVIAYLPIALPYHEVVLYGLSWVIIAIVIKKMKEQERDQLIEYNSMGNNM